MFKKVKVVMLPTNKKSNLVKFDSSLTIYEKPRSVSHSDGFAQQHLYLVSNDRVEEGDWVIGGEKNLAKVKFNDTKDPEKWIVINSNNAVLRSACKKIVATTDESLRIDKCDCNKYSGEPEMMCNCVYEFLPKLPKAFINEYVTAYNLGNVIEYTNVRTHKESRRISLKTTIDNCIIIEKNPNLVPNYKLGIVVLQEDVNSYSPDCVIRVKDKNGIQLSDRCVSFNDLFRGTRRLLGNKFFDAGVESSIYANSLRPLHIHIISEDEIEDGDWCLMVDDFGNQFLGSEPQQFLKDKGHTLNKGLRKVVASTNQKLKLPKIPSGFTATFITNHNNGNIITYVALKYLASSPEVNIIKTDKDNFITVRKINQQLSFVDIKQQLWHFKRDMLTDSNISVEDWIKKNLIIPALSLLNAELLRENN